MSSQRMDIRGKRKNAKRIRKGHKMQFTELVELSTKVNKHKALNVNIDLEINGETWKAYHVDVANRDLLFACDKGTCTYFVDTYGTRHVAELFTWEKA